MAEHTDIEDSIAREGRFIPKSETRWPDVAVAHIDMDQLFGILTTTMFHAYEEHPPLRLQYSGYDLEISRKIEHEIDCYCNQIMNEFWNRLRIVAESNHAPTKTNIFQRKAPSIVNFQVPKFIAYVLSGIGPMRIQDTLRDVTVIYAPAQDTRDRYGRAYDHPVDIPAALRFMHRLTKAGIPMASLITRGSTGAYFPTCSLEFEGPDSFEVVGTVHQSHYTRNDVIAAMMFGELGTEDNPFECATLTLGFMGHETVINAVSEQPPPDGGPPPDHPGRLVNYTFKINECGIAAPANTPVHGRGRGIYILGRGRERYSSCSLARALSELEINEILRRRLITGGPASGAPTPTLPPKETIEHPESVTI